MYSAEVVKDRDDPTRSRGFGFVTFASKECVDIAVKELNNQVKFS